MSKSTRACNTPGCTNRYDFDELEESAQHGHFKNPVIHHKINRATVTISYHAAIWR